MSKVFTKVLLRRGFFSTTYRILYKGQRYSTVDLNNYEATNLVRLLNYAYNLGKYGDVL